MQTWDDKKLLAITNSQITNQQQKRHVELLEKNSGNGELNKSERQERA